MAVGNANPPNAGLPDLAPPHAAVWVSADGQHWERLPDEASLQLSWMNAVTERDGLLVAVGSRRADEETDTPAVWRSSDGRRWDGVQLSSSPGSIQDVAAGPKGFVAVGISSGAATAWLSPDGSTWTQENFDQAGGAVATRVAVNRYGFVAIGTSTVAAYGPQLVWFAPVGGVAAQQDVGVDLREIVAAGDRFIGIGDCGPLDCPPILVIGRPMEAEASPALSGNLVGTLHGDRDLEMGCAWLTDATGKQWEILWPAGYRIGFPDGREPILSGPRGEIVARAGDSIALNGQRPSGLGSYCMVGELFEATQVVGVQGRDQETVQ